MIQSTKPPAYNLLRAACCIEGITVNNLAGQLGRSSRQVRRAIEDRQPGNPLREQLRIFIEAAVIKIPFKVPPRVLTTEEARTQSEAANLRGKLRDFLKTTRMPQAVAAKQVKVSKAALCQWLKGAYPGNVTYVNARVSTFLQSKGVIA